MSQRTRRAGFYAFTCDPGISPEDTGIYRTARCLGDGERLQPRRQSRHFARAGVLVHDALADRPHQFRLSFDEGLAGGDSVAAGDGFLELAQIGPHARAARLVDFGSARDLADRFLRAGRIGHTVWSLDGGTAEPGSPSGNFRSARI